MLFPFQLAGIASVGQGTGFISVAAIVLALVDMRTAYAPTPTSFIAHFATARSAGALSDSAARVRRRP
jgi:hypothetical protein